MLEEPPQQARAPPVHHILLGGPTKSTGGGPNTATSLELSNILGFFGFLIVSCFKGIPVQGKVNRAKLSEKLRARTTFPLLRVYLLQQLGKVGIAFGFHHFHEHSDYNPNRNHSFLVLF